MLVGLREASPAEAAALKESRVTVFTMADIDALGMRDVMREAMRIATTGTAGFHVSYSPTATEVPGWAEGAGGMTVRETHQAMEADRAQRRHDLDGRVGTDGLARRARRGRDAELRHVRLRQADIVASALGSLNGYCFSTVACAPASIWSMTRSLTGSAPMLEPWCHWSIISTMKSPVLNVSLLPVSTLVTLSVPDST